ncbi:hypothetical protein RhiirB3_532844 [Rhizophagus irregularis]|nr:hypothetical protein RhiirB3_532844 [Rhizophagus irregularis]
MVFKKCKELLDFNDILAKTQLFHLECLLNKNNSTELNNILTKINQISNIKDSELLILVRCKVYVELKMYYEAMLDLNLLYDKNSYSYQHISYISFIYLLREYTDFWLYLNVNNNNSDLSKLGIINEFSKYMYENVLKLEGLGWIEYQLPIELQAVPGLHVQPSIEINGSINMQIDYVREGYNGNEITYIPDISNIEKKWKTCLS